MLYPEPPHPNPLAEGEGAIDTAIAHVLAQWPVSAARVAPRCNAPAYALAPTANPRPLSVQEAVALQLATSDTRILRAEAAALRQGCVPLMNFDTFSELDLLSGYAAWHSCLGELLLAVTHAIHDRHITRADFERVRYALQQDAARGLEFLKRMEALIHAK